MSIVCVYTNKHRPFNAKKILQSVRGQSVPVRIIALDASAGTEKALPVEAARLCDEVVKIEDDPGPTLRFRFASQLSGYDYVYFQVDDHAPGETYVEYLLRCADECGDWWATIGQDGRRVSGEALGRRRMVSAEGRTACDVITSCELARLADMRHAVAFMERMQATYGDEVSAQEDDMYLCFGIQMARQAPCFTTIKPEWLKDSWRRHKLYAPNALCARPDHHERRDRFVRQAMALGWRSYA